MHLHTPSSNMLPWQVFAKDPQPLRPGTEAPHLDVDGLPFPGTVMQKGMAVHSEFDTASRHFKVEKFKSDDSAVVDQITLIGTGDGCVVPCCPLPYVSWKQFVSKRPRASCPTLSVCPAMISASPHFLCRRNLQKATVKMRFARNPVIGDKFSSRHGQKGVLSFQWPDEDMPFCCGTGMRPDIIINPHAFPSRMTIGMLVESMASKIGALSGTFVDATPFASSRRGEAQQPTPVQTFGEELLAHGFSHHGGETMVSGVTGEEFKADIFCGLVYYQRLRHMVSDKFQVRSVGQISPLTHQPIKGRKVGGGIRFGEMERDSLLAHGAAFLLHDRLHLCSDRHVMDVCTSCCSLLSASPVQGGGRAAGGPEAATRVCRVVCSLCRSEQGIDSIAVPYVFKYLASELAAMNIKLNINVSKK